MSRIPVNIVVVTAVRLINNDNDVAPVRQQWMLLSSRLLVLGQPELLQGCEVDSSGAPLRQLFTQRRPTRHLLRLFWQQCAGCERVRKLVVQLRPVSNDNDGGVRKSGVAHHLGGEQLHLHRLAGPLRMPHHPRATVGIHRPHSTVDRLLHGEVLVGFGNPLQQTLLGRIESNVVPLHFAERFYVE